MLEILDQLEIRTFHLYISGSKPHLISRFNKVKLGLKSTS